MNTHEYNDRYERIITAWEAPETESHGELVRLMDGYKRYVRRDGLICVTLVRPDNTSVVDSGLAHEQKLLDEVGQFPKPASESRSVGVATANTLPVETKPSLSADGLSESDRLRLRQSVAWEALSVNTRASYQKGLSRLERRGVDVDSLTDEGLAAAISMLDVSPATLSLTVAAVKWYHRHVLTGITEWETTEKRLISLRRDADQTGKGQVEGLQWSDVDVITRLSTLDGSIKGIRDACLVRLMSDCLLRISEVVAVNVEDLSETTLLVQRSKTDQMGEGATLYVGQATMELIRSYQSKAGIQRGALFLRLRRGDTVTSERLTMNGARKAIKDAAELVGISPEQISGHSLRVGSAVSLAKAGASVVEMQQAGRWKSPQMPAHYARVQEAEQGAVARFRYGKGRRR